MLENLIDKLSDESGSATVDWFVFSFGVLSLVFAVGAVLLSSAGADTAEVAQAIRLV